MLVFWLSFLLSDLMPIATALMHGSVAMEKEKKKKKRREKRELNKEQREKEKSKEEDKNCESIQITTWHVFIYWRKSSVLRPLRTEIKLYKPLACLKD